MTSAFSVRRIRRMLVCAASVVCVLPVALRAQTPTQGTAQASAAEAAAYTRAKEAATRAFFDRKRPEQERIEAMNRIGYPEPETVSRLLSTGSDKTESDLIRWEALRRVPYGDGYRNVVFRILEDPADGGEELDSRLIEDLGRRTTSIPPAEIRQRIQSILRKLIDDERDKVRLSAYRALVANHDQVAVSILDESLRNKKDVPIPLAEAIDLLNEDGSTNHITAIRPYLDDPDEQVRAKAAQALAVDAQSRPKITAMATSGATPVNVRLMALRALSRADAEFMGYAIALVEDTKTDPRVRDAAMHTIVGRMNYTAVPAAQQVRFAKAVDRLAAEPGIKTGDALKAKQTAEQLRPYLRKAFPEIQKQL